jgi:hypothetical protein
VQHLERHGPVVTEILSQEYRREPTTAELALDAVLAAERERQRVTWRQ